MRYTSRDLLAFAAFIALALASLRVGGMLAGITISLAALASMAFLIVALVDCGFRRAFAIGFLVPFLSYAGIHVLSKHNELDPFDGRLAAKLGLSRVCSDYIRLKVSGKAESRKRM